MARFLTEHGLLIQHIPRTGGTWIEKVLEEHTPVRWRRWVDIQPPRYPKKHALMPHYYPKRMGEIRYSVAFVRHPLQYYESVWSWITSVGSANWMELLSRSRWHPKLSAIKLWDPDFNQWCRQMVELEPGWATRLFEWYVGPDGGEYCCFVGRTETLAADLITLLEWFRIEHDAKAIRERQPANVRTIGDRPQWDPATRDLVARSERVAIRRWYGLGSRRGFF